MMGYKKLRQELMYQGTVVGMYKDIVELPNGKVVEWDLVKHKGAAAIIPVAEDGRILLVKQYRNALDRMTLEIPAGGINLGEEPRAAAIRELNEETGFHSECVDHLFDLVTAIGFCDETIYTYVARNLIPSHQNLDEDEFVEIIPYTLEEITNMILDGTIHDAKTIAGVLTYKNKYLKA